MTGCILFQFLWHSAVSLPIRDSPVPNFAWIGKCVFQNFSKEFFTVFGGEKKVRKLKLAENCRYSNWLCILPEHAPTTLRATSPFCFCEGNFHCFCLFSIGLAYLLCLCCFFERKKNIFLLIYDVKLIFLFCLRDHFECGGYLPPCIRFCFPKSASHWACVERNRWNTPLGAPARCFPTTTWRPASSICASP